MSLILSACVESDPEKNNARTGRALKASFLDRSRKIYLAAGAGFAFLDFFAFLAMMFFQIKSYKKCSRKEFSLLRPTS